VPKLFWEDLAEGSIAEYGPRLVTREEIVAFAAEFDPQPMHLDEDAARSTLLAGSRRRDGTPASSSIAFLSIR
jgi:acyl dehydratase